MSAFDWNGYDAIIPGAMILMEEQRQGVTMADGFIIKDSGERKSFSSGMVRDVTTDKIDYSLALDGPMFKRLAAHLTKGAKKYAKRNWMKAEGAEELERFKESALRHFLQWYWGETDEDHAAAVLFNVNGVEYVKERMRPNEDPPIDLMKEQTSRYMKKLMEDMTNEIG